MEIVNWFIDAILLVVHAVFSFAPPLVGLTYLSAAVGVGMLWVFGKTSNQKKMKQVKRRVQAGLLELRVYVDEPAISLRAQKTLLAANLNYLALALRPALWMALPVGLLLIHLASFYDRTPLPLAEPALVTMRMTGDLATSAPPPQLIVPPNVAILGPPVRVTAAREVSWRIVPFSPFRISCCSASRASRFRNRSRPEAGSVTYRGGRSRRFGDPYSRPATAASMRTSRSGSRSAIRLPACACSVFV